jgi:catechol 2,3-dioxygenase-like lactoylglutathione lyase family enzyme
MKKHDLRRILFLTIACITFIPVDTAQNAVRPPVWGIAKMTFLVSDFQLARAYYGEFLGFDEAFSYPSDSGKIISFKVNDRQYLEFIEDKRSKEKPRLVSVSLETNDVVQMRKYLEEKGVKVPANVTEDDAGNKVVLVHDPHGIPVEFVQFGNQSLHLLSRGKYLSERRISKRIHHVGLYCKEVLDDDPFWAGIMGCKELWRYPESHQQKVEMNYLQLPDCVENIEHYPSDDINFSHPCLLVDDMQETIYTLKERQGNNKLAKPVVGKGKRWLLNLKNDDGTKVEFTEAHTIR